MLVKSSRIYPIVPVVYVGIALLISDCHHQLCTWEISNLEIKAKNKNEKQKKINFLQKIL